MTEVKRTNWSRFFKRFNLTNRYRPVSVRVKTNGKEEATISDDSPLIGLAISKKGRFIDGIDLFTTKTDPDTLTRPTISIKEPVKITADRDKTNKDLKLLVESKDGSRLTIDLFTDGDSGRFHSYVEKLAYNIYEKRGQQTGHDVEDWLEAERMISETAEQLTH